MSILLFPYLSLSTNSEAMLVAQLWETILDSRTLTTHVEISVLLQNQKIVPIVGWEAAMIMQQQ